MVSGVGFPGSSKVALRKVVPVVGAVLAYAALTSATWRGSTWAGLPERAPVGRATVEMIEGFSIPLPLSCEAPLASYVRSSYASLVAKERPGNGGRASIDGTALDALHAASCPARAVFLARSVARLEAAEARAGAGLGDR